jgi:hypothetical protein
LFYWPTKYVAIKTCNSLDEVQLGMPIWEEKWKLEQQELLKELNRLEKEEKEKEEGGTEELQRTKDQGTIIQLSEH